MNPERESDAFLGRSVERVEDDALLGGRGRFVDDVAVSAATLHAAILRSPHGHALITSFDASDALAIEGVSCVLSGEDVRDASTPFLVGVRQPMAHWCLAVDRVRYCGEPVAVVLAEDRYRAEDALAAIRVCYQPLDVVVDAERSAAPGAPLLHPDVGSNVVSDRSFRYGDPDAAFASAAHRFELETRYPRNACTPIECIAVVARYCGEDAGYDVLSNFQGPFSLQPVMARALGVEGARLRLRSAADSGGSFGVKQAAFPYIVAMCLASRKAGRPVKWVEDRLEHLQAATSASNRVTHLQAAVDADGTVRALRFDQLDDCGAYLRAPEPASLYRTHGHMTGPYAIANLAIRNRVVLSNKTPSGLNRGFGGPQVYFPLERLMQRIAHGLGLEPLDVIRRNLVATGAFPYRAAAGALLDSGDYAEAVSRAVRDGGLAELERRRTEARAGGRLYGIGFAAVVEPSISNMGYITTVLTPEERERAGPKNGGTATATVSIDASGSVHAHVSSVPQGQGHRTVAAQVVADALGVALDAVTVNVEHDTQRNPWTISSGNYASRFSGAVAGAVHLAAMRVRGRLAAIAARELDAAADDLEFVAGQIRAHGNPDSSVSLRRIAGLSHWSPGALAADESPALRETVFWTMPQLAPPDAQDRVNSSGAYGFIFDYCGVEVEPVSGRVRIDRYVTMHDAGRRLNPALVDGQIRGGFAHGLGAALFESFHYGADGSFLSGTFADYLVPTACEVPEPVILHMESPSPFTPLGAKGVGEGNCMSTPVCLANAVADAIGIASVELPMTPGRVSQWIADRNDGVATLEAPAPGTAADTLDDDAPHGEGSIEVGLAPHALWDLLLDPEVLRDILPGCTRLDALPDNHFQAELGLGVGPVRGRFEAGVQLRDLDAPHAMTISGRANGPLGSSLGHGSLRLHAIERGSRVQFSYRFQVSGKVAAVGARMLEGAARAVVARFFKRLVRASERRR